MYKLEQNNKIQQQILKVVLLMIPLDEEELNSEHEVKANWTSCVVKDVVQTKTLQNNKFNIERNAYNLLKPQKRIPPTQTSWQPIRLSKLCRIWLIAATDNPQ
jgi:hypothetical protein